MDKAARNHGVCVVTLALLCLPLTTMAADKITHPVFPQKFPKTIGLRGLDIKTIEQAKKEVETVMAIPDQVLDAWNPPLADNRFAGCPNCTTGIQYSADNFDWSPQDPQRITCKHCKHDYPSEQYPLDKVTEVVSPAGILQKYPYFLNPKDNRKYYIDCMILNIRRVWLIRQALTLAILYNQTGELSYAHKAGVIIKRFAEIYPDIPVHGHHVSDYARLELDFFDIKMPDLPPNGVQPLNRKYGDDASNRESDLLFPYDGIRTSVGSWHYDEVPTLRILAYDQIAETLDQPARDLIEDYIRQTVNYTRTYPWYLSNADCWLIDGWIVAGRVIGEPAFIHAAVERASKMYAFRYFPDGMWMEGCPAYSPHLAIFKSLKLANGYSDPPGFKSADSGGRIDHFDAAKMAPKINLILDANKVFRTPNGTPAAVRDTYGYQAWRRRPAPPFKEDRTARSALLWAIGHGVLGRGRGQNQIEVRLQFMGTLSHAHLDKLNLQLFAKNREMICDIGYTHTNLREFSWSTVAHNLVMVDEQRVHYQWRDTAPGEVLFYGDAHPDVQFLSVDFPKAYDQTNVYRRSLALVGVSETDAYVVDLFEVEGGWQHDWLLHGDADHNSSVETNVAMQPRQGTLLPPGERFVPWKNDTATLAGHKNTLGLVRNLKAGRTDEPWQATFKITPEDGAALRVTMLESAGVELLTGEMPSIRQAHEIQGKVMDYWMPVVIARRRGANLKSEFLAVHEPYMGEPFITSIKRSHGALIVRTKHFTDVHLFYEGTATYGFKGRYGFLRIKDNQVISAYCADGTRLHHGQFQIELQEPDTGKVLKSDGKQLLLSGKISLLNAERIYLSYPTGQVHAVPIENAQPQVDTTIAILKRDPSFTLDEDAMRGRFTAFPNSKFEGPVEYRIPRHGLFTLD